jgi:hypothetical protein
MESDAYDTPRWEEAFGADRKTDARTLVDDEPWAVYRGTGMTAIAPPYVEAYLAHLDGDTGRIVARERRYDARRPPQGAERRYADLRAAGTPSKK